MSAFQLSAAHIAVMVATNELNRIQARIGGPRDTKALLDECAMLATENAWSLAARYPQEMWEMVEVPAKQLESLLRFLRTRPVTFPAFAKTIFCYQYQTCEHPGWRTSEAFDWCAAAIKTACQALPGYADAPWGIDECPQIPARSVRA